jgi:hypothetical protein
MDEIDALLQQQATGKTAAPPLDEITALLSQRASEVTTKPTAPQPRREGLGTFGNTVYGAAKGAADLVQAPAQLLLNGVNSALQNVAPDSGAASYIGEKTRQFNDHLTQQENQYQQETPGSIAAGAGRVAANVIPFLMTGGGSAAPAASKAMQLAKAIGSGAGVSAVTQPINNVVTDESGKNDFMTQKGLQAAIGAAGGGVGHALGRAISGVINPAVSKSTKAALDEGITPTIGQMLGGTAANVENKLTSMPFVGDMIKQGQRATTLDFNRAAYNRALKPIGQNADNLPLGHEGILAIKKTLGDNYDDILSKISFKGDAQAGRELADITREMGSGNVTPAVAEQFNRILKNNVLSKMSDGANMSGERYKIVLGDLSNLAKTYGKSLDPNQQILGQQLGKVQEVLKDNLVRTNPDYAGKLQANHNAYANFVRLRQAAAGVGTENGIFTPSQLAAAVKAQDSSVGKGASATGKALMQDLVKTGKDIAPTFPDSGTASRLGEMATLGTLLTQPQLAIPAAAGGVIASAPYTPAGKKLAAALLTRRPASAPAIAQGVQGMSPALGAILAGGAIPMLGN